MGDFVGTQDFCDGCVSEREREREKEKKTFNRKIDPQYFKRKEVCKFVKQKVLPRSAHIGIVVAEPRRTPEHKIHILLSYCFINAAFDQFQNAESYFIWLVKIADSQTN